MRRAILPRIVFVVIATCILVPTPPAEAAQAIVYTVTPINVEMSRPLAVNDRGDVLFLRSDHESPTTRLETIIINKEGGETAPLTCPNSASPLGVALNNRKDVVGSCSGLGGVVANPESGTFNVLRYPGAVSTTAAGINDMGQVVGSYIDPLSHRHSFFYDPATGQYRTIDHPLSVATGSPTYLTHINNKGQMAGYYEEPQPPFTPIRHAFVYENGSFTPVQYPGADETSIDGLNNRGEIFGA